MTAACAIYWRSKVLAVRTSSRTGFVARCAAWVWIGLSSRRDSSQAIPLGCDQASPPVRGLVSLRFRSGASSAYAAPYACQDRPSSIRPAHLYQSVPSHSSSSRHGLALGEVSLRKLTRQIRACLFPPALSVSPSFHSRCALA